MQFQLPHQHSKAQNLHECDIMVAMQPPILKEEVVIRTLKDDMSEMHSVSVVSAIPSSTSSPMPAVPGIVRQEKTIQQQPARTAKRNRRIVLIGTFALFLLLVTAGGWYGYMWWASRGSGKIQTDTKVSVAQVIPKEAIAVVSYSLESDSLRAGVKSLWDSNISSGSRHALDGDPRELLGIQDIHGVYYVVMQDNQRPFLLIEKTPSSTQYVATQSGVLPLDKNGWYVVSRVGTSQYQAALERGTLMESGGLPPQNSLSAVARIQLSAPYASKIFNDVAGDALGISRIPMIAFEIDAPSGDGTIRANATSPVSAEPEKINPSVEDLLKLVPGDVEFTHIGFDFAKDTTSLQQETARLDGNIIEQPAIRQFISLLSTPYAIFKRTGSDGVRDIGIIVALPESLKKKLKTGEPIIEQALPAFIPLIIGKVAGIQSAFHDGAYQAIPVRYTNITGQTQALDYVVGDSFILISSSREGMSVLLDNALGGDNILQAKDPWKSLFSKSAAIVDGKIATVGYIQDPLLLSLLPVPSKMAKVPAVFSEEVTSTEHIVHASLLVQQ